MKIIDTNFPPAGPRGWLLRLMDRLFFYESMSGNGACPIYLERWTLFDLRKLGYAVYLHRFLGDDWAIDPHDHPRRFISIGLWGWYWEDVFTQARANCSFCGWAGPVTDCRAGKFSDEDGFYEGHLCPDCYAVNGYCEAVEHQGDSNATIRHRAPWIRTFPANHLHRVRASEHGNCWTLVIVLPKSRAWGFVQDGKWIAFKEYVFGGKSRKSC